MWCRTSRNAPFRLADKRYRFGYATLWILSPPYDTTKSTHFITFLKDKNTDIQFTGEVEEDGKLPFLDSEVLSQDDNSLRTKIYRKLTHTERLLDEPFYNPISHKPPTIRTLHTSCDGRNVSHHYRQQFFLGLLSTGRWDYTITSSKILVNFLAARYQN